MTQIKDDALSSITKMANTRPEAVAIRFVGDDLFHEVNYDELQKAIQKCFECFEGVGLLAGDRVALWGSNSPEWMFTYLALVKIGSTIIPLDSKLTNEQLLELVQQVEPMVVVVDKEHYASIADLIPEIMHIQMETATIISGKFPTESIADAARPLDIDPSLGGIVFTSGSTAQPKGVMLSRESVAHATGGVIQRFGITESTELLCILPFHHVLGLGACLATIQAGGSATLLQDPRADLLLKAMKATSTTLLPGPPRLFELLLANIHSQMKQMPTPVRIILHTLRWFTRQIRTYSKFNPGKILFNKLHKRFGGNLKVFISGGAALPGEVRAGLEELGFDIVEGYGLTETAGSVSINTLEHNRAGTVGQAFPGLEVRIANQDVNGEGEIWVKGPTNMVGYFHDPQATKDIFRDENWLRTGDIGFIDKDGFISITGRIKELIVTSAGKNVSPEAVEHLYRKIEGVKELAVLGMPSPTRHGEEIHAAVVPQSNTSDSSQQIHNSISACSSKIPSYLQIIRIHLVAEIPRTTTLKVRRAVLRQMLLEQKESNVPKESVHKHTETDEVTDKIMFVVRGIVGSKDDSLTIDSGSALIFDLGIDSLGLIELASSLQQEFHVQIDLAQIQSCKTVADVDKLIRRTTNNTQDDSASKTSNPDQLSDAVEFKIPPLRTGNSLRFLTILRVLFRWLWDLKVEGLLNLPEQGPFILCPNHESHFDVLYVSSSLPLKHQKTFCTFAKRELFDAFFTRWITRIVRAVPVDRKGDFSQALNAGVALLKAELPILIHPEGTRTSDGTLQPFRRGAAHLALKTGVPLIPVHIDGSYEIFPTQARIPKLFSFLTSKPLRLRIQFGKPLFPEESGDIAESERILTNHLRREIELLGGNHWTY